MCAALLQLITEKSIPMSAMDCFLRLINACVDDCKLPTSAAGLQSDVCKWSPLGEVRCLYVCSDHYIMQLADRGRCRICQKYSFTETPTQTATLATISQLQASSMSQHVRRMLYFPLLPRLGAMLRDPATAEQLLSPYERAPELPSVATHAVWHGDAIARLRAKGIGNTDVNQLQKGCVDILLAALGDAFAPFGKFKKHSTWVLWLMILNLPAAVRRLVENLLCSVIVFGPNKPSRIDVYLKPLVDELLHSYNGSFGLLTTLECERLVGLVQVRSLLAVLIGDLKGLYQMLHLMENPTLCACPFCRHSGIKLAVTTSYGNFAAYEPCLRTHDEWVAALTVPNIAYKNLTRSAFIDLPYVNIAELASLDTMHCYFLGIVKRLSAQLLGWKDKSVKKPAGAKGAPDD
eukprot:TRINITY_DN271_c0_g1_i8.p1 TRINITY_DN271_c0_g1~~TRINITY_DN271_c0_g1_i8.p1  ORF type:complete len:405 (-),score=44.79 TRINITY_DN271_c0_g1_i8:1497-2711(-)